MRLFSPFASLILALAACSQGRSSSRTIRLTPTAEAGPVKGVDRSHKGKPAPDAMFNDPDGGEISLADFKGVPVLVNLWASWCAPCVKELPTLEGSRKRTASTASSGSIAVSQDMRPAAVGRGLPREAQGRRTSAPITTRR